MARISVQGEGAPSEWELKAGTVTIGRKPDNDVQLEDPTVSGHHAKIVTYFQSSYIEDLCSTNGTFVNGRRVRMHTLHAGDRLQVGKFELLFDGTADSPAWDETVTVANAPLSTAELSSDVEVDPVSAVEPDLSLEPELLTDQAAPDLPEAAADASSEPEPPPGAYFQVMVGERAGERVPVRDAELELPAGVRILRQGDQFVVRRSELAPKGVVRLNSRELGPAGAPLRDMDMLQVNSVWMAFFSG